MTDMTDLDSILDAYDHLHDERANELRQAEKASIAFDADFRQVIASVVRPYFEEVAAHLQAHGHSALVEEGSITSPDHRLAGGSKITLAFLPKDRAQLSLHHQLELNDAPHLMLRCDKRRKTIELFQDPDPGIWSGGPISEPNWPMDRVTRENLQERVIPMIAEVLRSPYS